MKKLICIALLAMLCSFVAAQQGLDGFAPSLQGQPAQAGLKLNIKAGIAVISNAPVNFPTQTITLTATATNYIYVDMTAGVIAVNTTGFSSSQYPIATAITDSVKVITLTDVRPNAFGSSAGGGAVSSVFTRAGAVVATTGDYTVAQVTGAAPTASPTFTGTVSGVTATMVGLGSVTNDVQTKAAIVPNTAPAAGQIPVGNAGGTAYAPVGVSGDASLASTGAITNTKINGTTVPTNAAADQVILTSSSAVGAWTTFPACADSTGNHLNFTHAGGITCGTSGLITSVFGRTGVVAAAANDYTLSQINDPTADKTFTFPISSTVGLTLSGTSPASVSTATGTNAPPILTVSAVTGGADSNATGTAGIGSSPAVNAGNGGAGTGTNAVGGAGGTVNLLAGNGGASLGTGINSNGGNIIVTPGTAGTGGSGTAGKSGVFQVAGANAGFFGLQQGAANTSTNIQIPANTAIWQAPAAVTSYFLNIPSAAATNSQSTVLCTNANPMVCSFAKTQQTTITTGTAYTNATTTFTDVKGSTGQTLSFAVEASTNYVAECYILWQGSATTTGPKFQFTGPASPTNVALSMDSAVTATTSIYASATAFSSAIANTGTITITTNFPAHIHLGVVNGVNAGTVTLQSAANGVGTLTIQDGSWCKLQ